MAKNRVAPDRPVTKRDNFFTKPKSNFKAKTKTDQFKTQSNFPVKKNRLVNINNESNKTNNYFTSTKTKIMKPSKQSTQNNDVEIKEKKPFDKKKWRLQKYSNKYKLQQWEDKRKKAVLRGYYKNVKDDRNKFDVQKIYKEEQQIDENVDGVRTIDEENENNLNKSIDQVNTSINPDLTNNSSKQSTLKSKSKAFKKAHLEFQRIKEEKQKSKEEALRRKKEREDALKEYKRKKTEKYKKLSKKTRKGQPVMKDRMEMLLEKIQNSLAQQ